MPNSPYLEKCGICGWAKGDHRYLTMNCPHNFKYGVFVETVFSGTGEQCRGFHLPNSEVSLEHIRKLRRDAHEKEGV